MSNLNNVLIRANGKEYYVNYKMSAFMMLERNHGITIDKIMQDMEDLALRQKAFLSSQAPSCRLASTEITSKNIR